MEERDQHVPNANQRRSVGPVVECACLDQYDTFKANTEATSLFIPPTPSLCIAYTTTTTTHTHYRLGTCVAEGAVAVTGDVIRRWRLQRIQRSRIIDW